MKIFHRLSPCLRFFALIIATTAAVNSMERPQKRGREIPVLGTERKAKSIRHAHLLEHIPPHTSPAGKALFAAIAAENPVAVRDALGAGADVDVRNGLNRTPLHWAATIGNSDILEILLGAGAPLNVYDEVGATPLHDVVESGDSDSIGLLVEQPGIQVDPRDESDRTPLHIATLEGNTTAALSFIGPWS